MCVVYVGALQSLHLCFSNLTFPADPERKDKWKNQLRIGGICCVIGIIIFVIGVALWIAVGVVVSSPPNESKWFSLGDYNLYLDCLCISLVN